MRYATEPFLSQTSGRMTHLAFGDTLPRPPDGSIAGVVDQQGLSHRPHKQVLEAGLGGHFR